jgi:hypothetical protein
MVFKSAFDKIKSQGGGTLVVSKGIYPVTDNIDVPGNTIVRGKGMDATVIKLADSAPRWERSGLLRSRFTKNIAFYDLTLDGNKGKQRSGEKNWYGRYGIYTEASSNVVMERVRIKDFQGYGFDPHGWKKGPNGPVYGKNITIKNCVADNNDWDGFTLDQSYGYHVERCVSRNNGRHGYNLCTGSKNAKLINNIAVNNGWYYYKGGRGCGINVVNNQEYGTGKAIISGNTITASKSAGVCLNDVFDISISNNKIYAGTYDKDKYKCMYFEKVVGSVVKNNLCPVGSSFDTRKSPTGIVFSGNKFVLK